MEVPIVKVMLDEVEWWPVYELSSEDDDMFWGHTPIHIPKSLLERYNAAHKEFTDVQNILRNLNES